MSVTFSLPCEFRTVTREDYERVRSLPCPECGGHDLYTTPESGRQNADIDCRSCYGYGGDTAAADRLRDREADEDGEFNVANGNAAYIVQDLLNLPCSEVYGGELCPTMILVRLASVFDTAAGVVEPSETQAVRIDANGVGLGCRVINMGRTQRQVESYVRRLRRLAEIAVERGAPSVVWG